jgi:hypothetical protein
MVVLNVYSAMEGRNVFHHSMRDRKGDHNEKRVEQKEGNGPKDTKRNRL